MRLATRSAVPAERALQSRAQAVLGWLVLSVLVVGGVLLVAVTIGVGLLLV